VRRITFGRFSKLVSSFFFADHRTGNRATVIGALSGMFFHGLCEAANVARFAARLFTDCHSDRRAQCGLGKQL
jgi:hypothetical protein